MINPENLGADFKSRREAAEVSQYSVCIKSGIPRTRLSFYENGYVALRPEELDVLEHSLKEIVRAKQQRLDAVLATA